MNRLPLDPLRTLLLAAALVMAGAAVATEELLVTGQVESESSQYAIVPLTTNFRATISFMVDEGDRVDVGDVVVRFDGTSIESQLRAERDELDRIRAQGERDIAGLRIALAEAELALATSEVDLDVARMEAEVPGEFIGELEYEENQLAWERARNLVEQNRKRADNAERELAEREATLKLDSTLKAQRIERSETMLESFVIHATQPGFVIYNSHPWMRNKFNVGDTVQTGWGVATVADDGAVVVVAWVNEVDAPRIDAGGTVTVRFDAIPDVEVTGVLESISPAPEEKPDWGRAAYHRAVVRLQRLPESALLPGMSALIEIPAGERS